MDHQEAGPAAKFLRDMFASTTTNPIFLCSLKNQDAPESEVPRQTITRNPRAIETFVRECDRANRGLFFCVSTLAPNAGTRCKENVSELTGLHADLDYDKIDATPEEIGQTLQQIALLPSKVVSSGRGLHCYWHFKEAVPATAENVRLVEDLLRKLADHLAGDPAVCEVSRLMRLPGTHNTKEGAWIEVKIVDDRPVRYDPIELEEWLDEAPSVLHRKAPTKGNGADNNNPFLNFAAQNGDAKPPIDVEARLAAMRYQGADETSIHQTQLQCTASMLAHGIDVDTIVDKILDATRIAAGKASARWNWDREERNVRDMCASWFQKHPEITRAKNEAPPSALRSSRASQYEMQAVEWLWLHRIAKGALNILAGLPDKGKGLTWSDIVARITTGGEWPADEGRAPIGNVVIFTAEDDITRTVVPRLVAASADLDRIEIVEMARNRDGTERMFNLVTDLPALKTKIEEVGDVILVIIDPVSAYLGVGKVSGGSSTDVRGVLAPLTRLAENKQAAILAIMHFNKKADITNAILRIADSLAYAAAARSIYIAVEDPENENAYLFIKAKGNLAPTNLTALRYMIGVRTVGFDKNLEKPIDAPFILWDNHPVKITAMEAMEAAAGGSRGKARDEAKDFLQSRLAIGPVKADDIYAEAKARCISIATIRRAKHELKIVSEKGHGSTKGEWYWRLPRAEDDHTRGV